MIWYCRHCMTPGGEEICPLCGKTLRWPVLPEDPCLVTELTDPWALLMENVLLQHHIPYMKRSLRGAALSTYLGGFGERFRFYVPYEYLSRARDIAEELFSENTTEEDII